jgi:hypothetical protein
MILNVFANIAIRNMIILLENARNLIVGDAKNSGLIEFAKNVE